MDGTQSRARVLWEKQKLQVAKASRRKRRRGREKSIPKTKEEECQAQTESLCEEKQAKGEKKKDQIQICKSFCKEEEAQTEKGTLIPSLMSYLVPRLHTFSKRVSKTSI